MTIIKDRAVSEKNKNTANLLPEYVVYVRKKENTPYKTPQVFQERGSI